MHIPICVNCIVAGNIWGSSQSLIRKLSRRKLSASFYQVRDIVLYVGLFICRNCHFHLRSFHFFMQKCQFCEMNFEVSYLIFVKSGFSCVEFIKYICGRKFSYSIESCLFVLGSCQFHMQRPRVLVFISEKKLVLMTKFWTAKSFMFSCVLWKL